MCECVYTKMRFIIFIYSPEFPLLLLHCMVIAWRWRRKKIAANLGLKSILNTPYSNSRGVYCWSHCHTNRCGWSYIVLLVFSFYFVFLLRSVCNDERVAATVFNSRFSRLCTSQQIIKFMRFFSLISLHFISFGSHRHFCYLLCFLLSFPEWLTGWLAGWLVGPLCLFASERVRAHVFVYACVIVFARRLSLSLSLSEFLWLWIFHIIIYVFIMIILVRYYAVPMHSAHTLYATCMCVRGAFYSSKKNLHTHISSCLAHKVNFFLVVQ